MRKKVIVVKTDQPSKADLYAANRKRKHPDCNLIIQEWMSYINGTNAEILSKAFLEYLERANFQVTERV